MGYEEAWRKFGKLSWIELFKPAINLARNGFRVSRFLASSLANNEIKIKKNEELSKILIDPTTKTVYKANDLIKNELLANTLEILSQQGAKAFYDGSLTSKIVQEINENGGNVSEKDFKNYKIKMYENSQIVELDENLKIHTPPLPSSGILISFITRIMKGYELKPENKMTKGDWMLFYHRLSESFKHAYAKRTFFGDPDFLNSSYINVSLKFYSKFLKKFY